MRSNNIFISHEGGDDEQVQQLKKRLKDRGRDVRNSSYESNNPKYDEGRRKRPSDKVIERYLKRCINWAGTFICLIGEETHKSRWVNYEIEQAHKLGKRIVGIYKHGCMDSVVLPSSFKKYGDSLIGWNSLGKLEDILNDKNSVFEKPNGSSGEEIYLIFRVPC
jgi:hypothetical protein